MFWAYYKIWKWFQDALLWLIFDKINKPKKCNYVLRIITGEVMYVQSKSVACFVIVLQMKQNNAFLAHCWATRYWKPCKNTKYSTTMPLWQIYVASNNNKYGDLHVNCPMLLRNQRIFQCSRPSLDVRSGYTL